LVLEPVVLEREAVALRWEDNDGHIRGAGGIDDLVANCESKVTTALANCGLDGIGCDLSSGIGGGSAGIALHADPDWVRIGVLNEVGEFFNANVIAQEVANESFIRIRERAADRSATTKDTAIKNDFQELVDNLVHKLDADVAGDTHGSIDLVLRLWLRTGERINLDAESDVEQNGHEEGNSY